MEYIFGGAFQGKLDYVKEHYGVRDDDIFYCSESLDIDWTKRVIYGLEKYSLACVREGLLPEQEIEKHLGAREDQILIATDIACGIVPTDKMERLWREANGRMLTKAALEADRVTRIFCGLPLTLKG